ncbi:MAG: YbhB/YbcL family Raf kinase inhibitor-like protein [Dongiaceae bacterium]
MKLTSTAFAGRGRIPSKHSCDGADLSPALDWSGIPEGTNSLVLVCSDPDAPAGTWYHWGLYDIPPSVTRLPEGYKEMPEGVHQAKNDFGRPGYGGPCPPKGHGTHHYHFRLYALKAVKLDVREGAKCKEVEAAAQRHKIAEADLVGSYSR